MKKHLCLTMPLLVASILLFAQSKIKGKILDAATQQALPGATITDLQNKVQVLSDINGNFTLPDNTDSLSVSCIGYHSLTKAANSAEIIIYLTPSFGNLNEVIVSGNREIQKRTEVPVAINVISKTQINEAKATWLDMLINKVPGVFMVDLGNEQHSMSVRQPLGYNSLFLYLEDGIPIRALGDFNHNALIEINQASLQRIEIIKGPASSLYGSEAVGGAINFITQSPTPFFSGKVQAEVGSRGYKRTDFNISNTYKKVGFYLGGYYANQDQKTNEHNNFNKTAITLRADYAFNEKTKLVTVADLIRYKTDQKGGLDSTHFYNKDYTSFYRFTYRKVNAFRLRSTLSTKWNNNNKTDFTLFYRNTSIGQNPFYTISDFVSNATKANSEINKDGFTSYGLVIQHSKKFNSLNLKWITGISEDYSPAEYLANYISVNKNSEGVYDQYQFSDSILTNYKVDLLNSAVYTQLEYKPLKNLNIVVAARYDRLDYTFDNHLPPGAFTGAPDASNHFNEVTPKLGLTYDFGDNRGVYINYSVGFAPPNINDLYRGVQVPTLQASTYKNYETGGWFAFAENKGYVEASIYKLDGTNEIVSVRQDQGSYANENAGITTHKGVELNLKYAPATEINFRIGGTVARHKYVEYINEGKVFSGNKMAQSPSYIMNGEVNYKPGFFNGFRIALESQSVGSYFTDPQNTSRYKGFTVLNMRAGFAKNNFELWFNCLNILNNNYAVTVEKSGYGTSYRPGQLRSIQLGIAYHFKNKKESN